MIDEQNQTRRENEKWMNPKKLRGGQRATRKLTGQQDKWTQANWGKDGWKAGPS